MFEVLQPFRANKCSEKGQAVLQLSRSALSFTLQIAWSLSEVSPETAHEYLQRQQR
ncbi:hypothetical protein DPMN_074434 [Dreissena polymorpha]|uniref:Uncharacterized protein n=1 Tax=Dreissena polymorpha TaxID=45954 RepID=A0A9D3YJS2_DREPO|nr:hypothetical protein DPMN_074434 [Dreissena polymorpha]